MVSSAEIAIWIGSGSGPIGSIGGVRMSPLLMESAPVDVQRNFTRHDLSPF
jgi:hypothetical protein